MAEETVESLRASLVQANARAEEADRNAARADEQTAAMIASLDTERAARLRAEAERDAYKQDRDLTAHRLAAAEAEVKRRDEYPHPCLICFGVRPASGKPCACNGTNNVYTAFDYLNAEAARLRLAYDDPTTDATDGAHPAWWRGSDAGVAGAVRIVNEALDGPLPLVGCVGGADLEAVRQRVAALRASVARLVEAGSAVEVRDAVEWLAKWAAAKGAGSGVK